MEFAIIESTKTDEVAAADVAELNELQLALVGGGSADVILA